MDFSREYFSRDNKISNFFFKFLKSWNTLADSKLFPDTVYIYMYRKSRLPPRFLLEITSNILRC